MKTKFALLLFMTIIFLLPLSGQDLNRQKKWSVAFGYSPLCYFNLNNEVTSGGDMFYWIAISGRIYYKFSDRLSILSGVSTRIKKINLHYDLYPNAYLTRVFYEFPIQLNYYFLRPSDPFVPYFKIGFINSYLKSSMVKPMPYNDSEFNLLFDAGLGTGFQLNKRLLATYEMGLGYFLKYENRNRAFVDMFLGLQYNF
jgi:hypothetical protein